MPKKGKIHCPKRGKYCRVRQAPPGKFAKGSFRTIRTKGKKGVKVVVGCPKGKWNKKTKRCRVGTRAQTLLYPVGSKKCRVCNR